jgi:aldehyde dehydrogenase (NAD+)
MWNIDQAYIGGAFVRVRGSDRGERESGDRTGLIGTATLGNRDDARLAIAAARQAQQRLAAHRQGRAHRHAEAPRKPPCWHIRTDIRDITIEEYGGPAGARAMDQPVRLAVLRERGRRPGATRAGAASARPPW